MTLNTEPFTTASHLIQFILWWCHRFGDVVWTSGVQYLIWCHRRADIIKGCFQSWLLALWFYRLHFSFFVLIQLSNITKHLLTKNVLLFIAYIFFRPRQTVAWFSTRWRCKNRAKLLLTRLKTLEHMSSHLTFEEFHLCIQQSHSSSWMQAYVFLFWSFSQPSEWPETSLSSPPVFYQFAR